MIAMVRGFQFQLLLLLPPSSLLSATTSVSNDRDMRIRKTDRFMEEERQMGVIIPKDVSRAVMAIRLAETVNDGYKKEKDDDDNRDDIENLSTGIYLESGIDAVYLAQIGDDYCAAAFRGTTNYQPGDWITNLYLGPVEIGTVTMTTTTEDEEDDLFMGCDVHRGYHEAYADFEYRERVEDFLQRCQSECPECETILTGHSQGGGIAQIAALYLKRYEKINTTSSSSSSINYNNNTSVEAMVSSEGNDEIDDDYEINTNDRNGNSPYVVTFAAPPSMGAGCLDVFSEDERRRWFRYIMATEGVMGNKLVYDPIPLLYAQLLDPTPDDDDDDGLFDVFDGFDFDAGTTSLDQTYARNGGLAFVGHEVLLSTEDPSAVLLSDFDGHRYVHLENIDLSGRAHYDDLYSKVLRAQDEIYKTNVEDGIDSACHDGGSDKSFVECPNMRIPSGGFAVGSLCNELEQSSSTCVEGTTCKAESTWLFWESARHTCQLSTPSTTPAAPSEGESILTEDESSAPVTTPTTNPAIDPAKDPAKIRITNSTVDPTTKIRMEPTPKPTATVTPMMADAPTSSSGFCHRPLLTRLRQAMGFVYFVVAGAMLIAASIVY